MFEILGALIMMLFGGVIQAIGYISCQCPA